MFVDDQTLRTYFQRIKDSVQCLMELNHLSQQEEKDTIVHLDQVRYDVRILTGYTL